MAGDYLYANFKDHYLFNAEDPITRERTKIMFDGDQGGFSTVNFDIIQEEDPSSPASLDSPDPHTTSPKTYGLFHGSISTKLPNRRHVQRSGYAGWRTLEPKPFLWGPRFHDLELFKYLAFRVKTDGRNYFVNVQTDSIEQTDLHQHRLFTKNTVGGRGLLPETGEEGWREAEWETVLIRMDAFVRTSYGFVVPDQKTMLGQRVRSVGMSVIDRVEGPYRLAVHSIWATNKAPEQAVESSEVDGKGLDWGI